MAGHVQLVVKHSDCGDAALWYTSHRSRVDAEQPLPDQLVHRCGVLKNVLDHEEGCTALPVTSSAFECWITGVGSLLEHCQACNVRTLCHTMCRRCACTPVFVSPLCEQHLCSHTASSHAHNVFRLLYSMEIHFATQAPQMAVNEGGGPDGHTHPHLVHAPLPCTRAPTLYTRSSNSATSLQLVATVTRCHEEPSHAQGS